MLKQINRITCFILISMVSFASSETKKTMTIVDLINYPSLGDPQLSPNGGQLLYTLSEPDWGKNKRISHIWRINSDGSSPIKMTNGENGESSPRWSPNGSVIAFIAERGESDDANNQIFVISNHGGEAEPLTNHETGVSNIQWSLDGKFIYFWLAMLKVTKKRNGKRPKMMFMLLMKIINRDTSGKYQSIVKKAVESQRVIFPSRITNFPGMEQSSLIIGGPIHCTVRLNIMKCG